MGLNVAFTVFNRPDVTEKVFSQIALARPAKLFLIADGPRPLTSDIDNCKAVRRIVDNIDWPCEVFRNFSEVNLGLGRRMTSGISWVFGHVEECIILEDDCLPSASFFRFCEEMLERYRDDERIMHINGYSYQFGHIRTEDSYYISQITCPWGWATWRRAWKYYDFCIPLWATLCQTDWLRDIVKDPRTVRYFTRVFDAAYRGESLTWSGQWTFSTLCQSGLSVSPREDLIMNLGFGPEATTTKSDSSPEEYNRPPAELTFPLRYPACMARNLAAEAFWVEGIAQMEAENDPPSTAQRIYAQLPAPVRKGLRVLIPPHLKDDVLRLVRTVSSNW